VSAEVGLITGILKYIWLPTIGLLGYFAKGHLNKLDTRLTLSETRVSELEKELGKNYYDKVEIQQHIVLPLQESISETRQELKSSIVLITEIHRDMAIIKYKILEETKNK